MPSVHLHLIDYIILNAYLAFVLGIGWYVAVLVSRRKGCLDFHCA